MASASLLGLGEVDQIGCVVLDLDESIRSRTVIDPMLEWRGWTYGRGFLGWQQTRGVDSEYTVRLAVTGTHPQLELIEPVDGDTSWARVLERGGDGAVHHLGYFVEDFWAEVNRIEAMGFPVLEAGGGHGLDGDGAFAYLDTTALVGVYTEVIQPARQRPEPHFVVTPGHVPLRGASA
ncbi:MAG: hypothetical protein JWP19_2517 [Rhodoglobus sp.]|nr:hypothetical protein [Rhodoglobus sp.]